MFVLRYDITYYTITTRFSISVDLVFLNAGAIDVYNVTRR